MAAAILMQLNQAGQIRLDEPAAKYLPDSAIPVQVTIREVMSHTSDGVPGEEFLYNGSRYATLSLLIERVTGRPYAQVVRERIFSPAKMSRTIPGLDTAGYESLQRKLARPYNWDRTASTEVKQGVLPRSGLSAATEVVSTVEDLARYAAALDGDCLISPKAKGAMFTPMVSTRGERLPYGLGWFVQSYLGHRLVWHFGQEDSYSSLFLRVPDRKLTLILLANSNAMSDAFRLLDGDASRSLFALKFLKDLVLSPAPQAESLRLRADEELDEGLVNLYAGRRERAISATRTALKGSVPVEPSVNLLYLLLQLREPSLKRITESVGRELVRRHPHLAPALFYFGTFLQETERSNEAILFFARIANIQPPLRHWTAALALLELAKFYSARDPLLARKYAERVIGMGLNVDGVADRARQMLAKLPSSP